VTPALDDLYRAAIRLHQQGRGSDAAAIYDRILSERPQHAGALHLKGVLAIQAGDYERAIDLIEQSVAIDPSHGLALANLGVAYRTLNRFEEAIPLLRRALEIDPNSPLVLANLGQALSRAGFVAESVVYSRRALEMQPNQIGLQSSVLFAENYLADTDPVALAERARKVGELIAKTAPPRTSHPNDPDPERKLRVGFVSGDLRSHPIGRFLLGALSGFGPGTNLEFFAYANRDLEDAITEALKQVIPNWLNVTKLTDKALDTRIAEDKIDVLFDLSGHTESNRLSVFSMKPAPVSMSWIGYFATTGLTSIDYVLASKWVIPEAEENQWVEKVWRLPDTYICFTQAPNAPEPKPLPALKTGHVTFGCFNNFNKLSDVTLAAWANLLAALPTARLILRSSGNYHATTTSDLRVRLSAAGIDISRVRIDAKLGDYRAHLASYDEIDVALDTFPYNGGTTTVEALYMGVPVLVRAGDRYVAHMGEGILHCAGLPEWIAPDTGSYAATGVRLTGDIAALAKLRAGLRARILASPLFDAPRFAGNLEAAIRQVWRIWCAAHGRVP
jgi:predicted O-linked N-acetylglucosamine transferase (SPINDLY family)